MFGHKQRAVDAVGIMTLADGQVIEHDEKRCCHCGAYWKLEPGSGKPHVHCHYCDDDTCSNPQCMTDCTPLEKRLEEESKFLQIFNKVLLGG